MSEPYPLPPQAVYVWLAGDRLMIGIPPIGKSDRPSTKVIPLDRCESADGAGIKAVIMLLKERQNAVQYRRPMTIGTPSDPVQYDLDKILQHMKPTKYDKHGKERLTLEDLGL